MSVRRALVLAYLEKYGSFLISLLSTIVLSRLLTPEQIGVFSIGMAFVGLIGVVREFGISTYVVQEPELDSSRISAAFTMTIAIGLVLAALVLLLSFPLGRFYSDSRITAILAILSLAFVITPFGGVAQALLTRELKFGPLAWIRLSHGAVLAGTSILLAWYGLGALSLAWAAVAATLLSTAMSLAFRPHEMKLTRHRVDLLRVLRVGGAATTVSIIDEVSSALPDVALGRLQSFAAVGLFSRARTMSQMAHQILARAAGPVFLAAFSELKRNGQPLTQGYLKATACIVAAGWAALAALAVLAGPVVTVLFGANWIDVVTPLRWLCLGAAISLLSSGSHHLLLADGAVGEVVKAKALALPGHILCVLAGAALGLDQLAIGLAVSSGLSSFLLFWFVRKRLEIGFLKQFSPALLSLPLVLAASAGSAISFTLPPEGGVGGAMAQLAVGCIAATVLTALALAMGSHPLKEEYLRFRRYSRGRENS